ncbi:femAB family protein [Geobacter sp. OR-1]|uniref:FemAB family XrtA/PEP-CTERM system-associated protein n=1 Tax=Geobacter sp. OR-1 TaxID=1266765 RepID=UPI000541F23E|nr:FemAB family XrtA/PEP-CTERM system-associated protein [Geobacter sp. OR-1]GAM10596.1 femAB family protein [Geobacter sp. OR-1]
MNVRTVTDNDQVAWDAFVLKADGCTAYHQFKWKTIIEKSFGHEGHYLATVDEDGEWQGVLPLIHMKSSLFGNFLVSVPFVNYGGLLCLNAVAGEALLVAAEKVRRECGADHVELRHLRNGFDGLPTRQHKVTMILELAGTVDEQWQAFNAKLRNQIRKPEKFGLVPEIGHVELLDGFYDVFARNMRDLGTPVYAKKFFYTVLDELADSSHIIAVRHEGRIIAAGIALWFGDTIEIPWASSIADFKNFCPNNMLYWEAIKLAIGNGFNKFDFGRSTPHEGTYNFKKQWGAEPVQLYWQYLLPKGETLPELNPKNPKFELAIKVWQKLPVGLTRLIGPPIVRNIP